MIEQKVEIYMHNQGHVALMTAMNKRLAELNADGWWVVGVATSDMNGLVVTVLYQKGQPEQNVKLEHIMPSFKVATDGIDPYTGTRSDV